MNNTAQLTDRLPDLIDSAWDSVVTLLKDYFIEHGDTSDLPCLHIDLDYSGAVSEIIDSTVPIYISELKELAYFHHDAAIAALVDQFGSADGNWPSGVFAAGLYSLIEQGVSERWYAEAEDLWDAWNATLNSAAVRKLALGAWQQSNQASAD